LLEPRAYHGVIEHDAGGLRVGRGRRISYNGTWTQSSGVEDSVQLGNELVGHREADVAEKVGQRLTACEPYGAYHRRTAYGFHHRLLPHDLLLGIRAAFAATCAVGHDQSEE
jgi:hypothetical protein